jgi:hypothetical protein
MNAPVDKNRTKPCTAIYRILMVEFERQRLARGLSMAQVDDLAGTQDGFYAKMIYPDTPNGRQSRWETVQDVADALFGRDFLISIRGLNGGSVSALTVEKGASTNALKNRHWRHSRHFAELGRLGGLARAKLGKDKLTAIGRKASKTRSKRIRDAARSGAAHKAANDEKRAT